MPNELDGIVARLNQDGRSAIADEVSRIASKYGAVMEQEDERLRKERPEQQSKGQQRNAQGSRQGAQPGGAAIGQGGGAGQPQIEGQDPDGARSPSDEAAKENEGRHHRSGASGGAHSHR